MNTAYHTNAPEVQQLVRKAFPEYTGRRFTVVGWHANLNVDFPCNTQALWYSVSNMKNKVETIDINGAEVELHWGEGSNLGKAVHTVPSDAVGDSRPSDGETFELRGKRYRLGAHDYSTDQPGSEDDAECTCSADIYAED